MRSTPPLPTSVAWLVGLLIALAARESPAAEPLPAEAQAELDAFAKASEEIHRKAEADLEPVRVSAVAQLKSMQDRYCREAKLDEAIAIREAIEKILGILPDPGYLPAVEADIGRVFLYQITGSAAGAVWGTGVYTSDSHLATAAVHAGVLQVGQKGVVRVTIMPGQSKYSGKNRHGVTSNAYGPWQVSFKVEPAEL
jgi:hypothetical protein